MQHVNPVAGKLLAQDDSDDNLALAIAFRKALGTAIIGLGVLGVAVGLVTIFVLGPDEGLRTVSLGLVGLIMGWLLRRPFGLPGSLKDKRLFRRGKILLLMGTVISVTAALTLTASSFLDALWKEWVAIDLLIIGAVLCLVGAVYLSAAKRADQ